jgi:hypothetical protein
VRRLVTALAVLAAIFVAAPAAGAAIQLERSIAGITLGMSRSRVISLAGRPDAIRIVPNAVVPFTMYRYGAGPRRLDITFFGGTRVVEVTTTRPVARTRGVGAGSTLAALRRRVPELRCVTAFGETICSRGDRGRTTQFVSVSGRVVSSSVAFVTAISP